VVEPRSSDQPLGTSIVLEYRGATQMSPAGANIATDANFIDAYGNATFCLTGAGCIPQTCNTNGVPTIFNPTAFQNHFWRSSITDLNTAKMFQVRVTFVSNTNTNLSPTLSALGFAFRQ
jgi:hypothetical protein